MTVSGISTAIVKDNNRDDTVPQEYWDMCNQLRTCVSDQGTKTRLSNPPNTAGLKPFGIDAGAWRNQHDRAPQRVAYLNPNTREFFLRTVNWEKGEEWNGPYKFETKQLVSRAGGSYFFTEG